MTAETIVLDDGRKLVVRPLLLSDEVAYRAFTQAVSPEATYYRFFSAKPHLTEREIDHFLRIDHVDREALVAVHGPDVVAVARYDRLAGTDTAEVAFIVRDDFQGHGLAPRLLRLLAAEARRHGIHRFHATVLPDNHPMLRVFARSGWQTNLWLEDGAVALTLDIDRSEVQLGKA
jgi:RimJ/RimL family protein N-acetyltransferase